MNDHVESMRLMLELALNSGRKRKSQQTGYLHHCYNLADQETHLPIPLIENFLYALALLRSRIVENVQEAKTILDGLLHFQNKTEGDPTKGNFPIYLHDYPVCKDRFIGLHVACAIYWILKQFAPILGQDLKKRLEEALSLSIGQAQKSYTEKTASYPIAIKLAAAALAVGQLTGDTRLSNYGGQMLDVLCKNPEESCWYCPASLGSIAASLLMVYPCLGESPWNSFWEHLQNTWHRSTGSYAGPSLKEWQQGSEPQVSIYDLLCGYYSDGFSGRALRESPVHLEAVLIPITDERFDPIEYPMDVHGTHNGAKWSLHHKERLAYSFIEKGNIEINPAYEKGFHPFRLIWGDIQRTHSFVCQGGKASAITIDKTDLIFELEGDAELEDREKAREILFFIDTHEGLEFLVSGQKASTFTLEDTLSIKDKYLYLSLVFELLEGEGRFLGHRMLGNRPAQIEAKGSARFDAYDWQVFLRTINRSDKCRLKVSLKMLDDKDAG